MRGGILADCGTDGLEAAANRLRVGRGLLATLRCVVADAEYFGDRTVEVGLENNGALTIPANICGNPAVSVPAPGAVPPGASELPR